MGRLHVIGAGLSGLGAAVRAAELGAQVSLYDQSPQAGGRARSYHDKHLGCDIDNGNHLMMAGNWAAMWLMDTIGAQQERICPDRAIFPFMDVESGKRWNIEFNEGRLPKWVFHKNRRVPGTKALDYLPLALMLFAGPEDTVADYVPEGHPLYASLMEPLCVAVVNASPEDSSAQLLAAVIKETVFRGATPSRPVISRNGLSATFAKPALDYLKSYGADVQLGQRVSDFQFEQGVLRSFDVGGAKIELGYDDMAILAVPPATAKKLVPDLEVPAGSSPILNVHFKLNEDVETNWPAPFMGLVNAVAQWVFVRGNIASVTISAADALIDMDADAIGALVWADVAKTLDMQSSPVPPVRVVKEKRATFLQTPENVKKRPNMVTAYANLLLAGDWTQTELPATIEGSVRSGYKAADRAVKIIKQQPFE
ncbi:MAG: hydroxysqualene dehydroxylase HpnE [Sphingomonadales bacterium]|jgi:squalene-associated FAD-dependent desaturase